MPNQFYGFSGKMPFFLKPSSNGASQGQVGNATSGGSFNRFTIELAFRHPFRIDMLLWDIIATQTYAFQQVSSLAASPTVIRTFAEMAVTGGTVASVPLGPPLYVLPSTIFLSWYCSAATVQVRRNSSNVPVEFTSFQNVRVGYDGGSTTTGSMAVRIIGQYWEPKRNGTSS